MLCTLGMATLLASLPLGAQQQAPEEQALHLLMAATQQSLAALHKVDHCLEEFRQQEARCIKGQDTAEALFALSEKASSLLASVAEARIEPYFGEEFLAELARIAKPYTAKTLPPVTP